MNRKQYLNALYGRAASIFTITNPASKEVLKEAYRSGITHADLSSLVEDKDNDKSNKWNKC